MHKVLTNPLYCGIIDAWGERHEARFEPLLVARPLGKPEV
jgi:hypothetical protein